jgi:DNA polymerase III epsilon subunit-like protein
MRPYVAPEPPSAPIRVASGVAPVPLALIAASPSARAPEAPAAVPQQFEPAPAPVIPAAVRIPAAPGIPGYLILDTETNGFKDPRLAAAALIFVSPELEIQSQFVTLVHPDGWTMGAEAQAVNGLSQEKLEAEGMDALGPLMAFEIALRLGYVVVAHNAAFDLRVLRGEARRRGLFASAMDYPFICTMVASRAMIGVGKLETAYEKLMNEPMTGMHDAAADALACLEVLRAMVKRGLDLRVVGSDRP